MRIICDINCESKYLSPYTHSESKVLNVSYLLPDNIIDFQIYWYSRYAFDMAVYFMQVHILWQVNKKKR